VHQILSTHPRYFLRDFPHEKPDRHHLPDDCRSCWKCRGELEAEQAPVKNIKGKPTMKKFWIFTLLSFLMLPASASADTIIPFEDIMNLMNGSNITYERIGHYERPFKVIKKSEKWILRQMENYQQSSIKDEGDNKISVNSFPSNWTINGTWLFTKTNNKCRIVHTGGGMVMRWNCGS
jgi:hypothetical protein